MSINHSNLVSYLKELNDKKSDLIIYVVICDIIGKFITPEIDDSFKALGLKTEFSKNKGFKGYLAIIDGGEIHQEKLGTQNEPMVYVTEKFNEDFIHVESRVTRSGFGQIFINGVNFSVNNRGFNFAVFNKSDKTLVDMCNFDMCETVECMLPQTIPIYKPFEPFDCKYYQNEVDRPERPLINFALTTNIGHIPYTSVVMISAFECHKTYNCDFYISVDDMATEKEHKIFFDIVNMDYGNIVKKYLGDIKHE
ncbi:MAG: hypothetical protein LBM93_06150 [Oscillospiraceae bacterium]|nr:hypothetical protein [Oscillospiraceae bacterium]